jgi:hypothetical protein
MKTAQSTNTLATDINMKIVDVPMVGFSDFREYGTVEGGTDSHKNWKVMSGALTYEGRIYVPEPLCSKVISLLHDYPESGHFGALRTAELESRDFYWLAINATVRMYAAGCEVCHRIKAPRYARRRTNMPQPPPHRPWVGVNIDFVTDLPESTPSAYTGILVMVDQLTTMTIDLTCRKDIESPDLARMFFECVICMPGIPDNIITDRGTQFTSRFCN